MKPSLEEAVEDETFGMWVSEKTPNDLMFDSAERRYSILEGDNGWFIDEMSLSFSDEEGSRKCSIYISWTSTYGKNGFAGDMVEEQELNLDAVNKRL